MISGGACWYSKWVPPARMPELLGAADDHVDALFLGHGQQPPEGVVVVQERVAPGEEEAVGAGLVQGEGQLDGLGAVGA